MTVPVDTCIRQASDCSFACTFKKGSRTEAALWLDYCVLWWK